LFINDLKDGLVKSTMEAEFYSLLEANCLPVTVTQCISFLI